MGVLKLSTAALAVLFIQSCSAQHDSPPPAKTIFDPLTQQLKSARDVQKTIDQSADAARKAVDSQERGDTSP
jgi:hypothetical protein